MIQGTSRLSLQLRQFKTFCMLRFLADTVLRSLRFRVQPEPLNHYYYYYYYYYYFYIIIIILLLLLLMELSGSLVQKAHRMTPAGLNSRASVHLLQATSPRTALPCERQGPQLMISVVLRRDWGNGFQIQGLGLGRLRAFVRIPKGFLSSRRPRPETPILDYVRHKQYPKP